MSLVRNDSVLREVLYERTKSLLSRLGRQRIWHRAYGSAEEPWGAGGADADSNYFPVRHRHHAEPDEYSPVPGTENRQAGASGAGHLLHHGAYRGNGGTDGSHTGAVFHGGFRPQCHHGFAGRAQGHRQYSPGRRHFPTGYLYPEYPLRGVHHLPVQPQRILRHRRDSLRGRLYRDQRPCGGEFQRRYRPTHR